MDHVAIMKKSWGLIPKILNRTKVAESRWYKSRIAPWNRIKKGHNLYFKNSGESVIVKTRVNKVIQYQVSNNREALEIMKKHAEKDLGFKKIPTEVLNYIQNKNYAIFIYFDSVKEIKPFNVDKTGFGSMAAWITINNINKIKI
ncbi:unnamed protein product [marine sediment metagenome]|uniref:ASCH domain-containing protein n=1 Tax=marine sediment metagenome TaxID=412755 RepID=X1T1A6_9ZZZZ